MLKVHTINYRLLKKLMSPNFGLDPPAILKNTLKLNICNMLAINAYLLRCNWARYGSEAVLFCRRQRLFMQITTTMMSINMRSSATIPTIPTTMVTTSVVGEAVAEGRVKLASIQASCMLLSSMLYFLPNVRGMLSSKTVDCRKEKRKSYQCSHKAPIH